MKKNTFLYIVIAVLVIALAGLGALNVRSLDKLASLQAKVNKLQKSVQEVSDSAAELSSKADQLDALYPDDPTVSSAAAAASSAEVQGPSVQEESTRYICSLRFFRLFRQQGQFFFHSGRRNSFSIQRKHFHRQFGFQHGQPSEPGTVSSSHR